MSIQKVLKDILYLVSSPKFIGTECFKLLGNNISSPGTQGSKKVSALKVLQAIQKKF